MYFKLKMTFHSLRLWERPFQSAQKRNHSGAYTLHWSPFYQHYVYFHTAKNHLLFEKFVVINYAETD